MAVIAALIGAVSGVVGLRTAYVLDKPAGPFIVCTAVFFVVVASIGTVRNWQAKFECLHIKSDWADNLPLPNFILPPRGAGCT